MDSQTRQERREEMELDIKMMERDFYGDDVLSCQVQRVVVVLIVLLGVLVTGIQIGLRQGYSDGYSVGLEVGNGGIK